MATLTFVGDYKYALTEGQCRLEVKIDIVGKEYDFTRVWMRDGEYTIVETKENWNKACNNHPDFFWMTDEDAADAWFESHCPIGVLPAGTEDTFKELEARWNAINLLATVY
jgi:hypothetical protein